MRKTAIAILVASTAVVAPAFAAAPAAKSPMTFFITSAGPGNGGNLGGLAGADRHCQTLASAAGAGHHKWHAYLSGEGQNARDRIGHGPWHNYNGDLIARSNEELHEGVNNINRIYALTEKGERVNGRADNPNTHDMLTGSSPDGRAASGGGDTNCGNWTKNSGDGSAIVGHHDRIGLSVTTEARSWNASHATKGCTQPNLVSTGGAGLFYCFASDQGGAKSTAKPALKRTSAKR